MEALSSAIGTINGIVWGKPMLTLILGEGIFTSPGLKMMSVLRVGTDLKLTNKYCARYGPRQ